MISVLVTFNIGDSEESIESFDKEAIPEFYPSSGLTFLSDCSDRSSWAESHRKTPLNSDHQVAGHGRR